MASACPRSWSGNGHVAGTNCPAPQTVLVLVQSMARAVSTIIPNSGTGNGVDSPQPCIRNGGKQSADRPRARAVLVHELAANGNYPRTCTGKGLSTSQNPFAHLIDDHFPYSN